MEEAIVITIGFVFLAIGLVSSVLPPLPGPPIAFLSLLLLHFGMPNHPIDTWLLVVMGIVAVGVTFLDNLAAVWGTKKYGGTKAGIRGSFIGLIIAVFFAGWIPFVGPFFAVLLGPFVGAVIGEFLAGSNSNTAFRSGLGSFLGFLMGVGIKIGVSLVFFVYFLKIVIFG